MKGARHILRFLLDADARGERTALVTLTDVVGSSSRAPGTHMAVSDSGAFVGSFSGGCVEAAVVSQAREVIVSGQAELMRYGAGSPYIDIRLPCGGGIDLLFTPMPNRAVLQRAADALDRRQQVSLELDLAGGLQLAQAARTGWQSDGCFVASHEPDLRLMIVGHGAETQAMMSQALVFGAEVSVLSPDHQIVAETLQAGAGAAQLITPGPSPHLTADRWSAVIMLFHDHDWEGELLAQALTTQAFYIGAMGSRVTHARRCERLAALGVTGSDIARVTGPVGLIPATRDPQTLALSVLAQIAGELAMAKPQQHFATHEVS